ncbi:hypothetical protein [Leptolyngbya sp. FACHB-17]|uniref:hypothetical protein n=1 Tax=unclassified Leptolyngbya TaxID=2650499 RepID=UPI001680AFEB|nr:hypothetical protein [Leptolyngbya sp. FACHB-17]MBD2083114.1 hypothetical protein [Leptolyngbya sp. FACHB-17]
MVSSLSSQYCVALSGQKWDVGNFTLWQSSDDDVILFSPKQATLARDFRTGRYQAAISQFRVQKDGAYKTVGGGALFTLSTGIEFDADTYKQIEQQWRDEVLKSGRAKSKNPRFVPLITRKGTVELLIPEVIGKASQSTIDNKEFGVIGSKVSLLANLTAEGAQALAQAVRNRENTPIGAMVRYEYLQSIPQCIVEVDVNGSRVFKHLSAQLKASYDGWFYGASLDLQAQWESMVRNGAIVVKVQGLDKLPDGMEEVKQNLLTTFIDQAFKNFFPMLFEKKPDVKPAEAGNTSGWYGGANFALKWRKESDVTNLSLKMEFNGFSWLKGAMDTGATFLSELDASYLNEVNTELTFPLLMSVSPDEMVKSVALSCSAMEDGRPVMIPASDVFGADVTSKQYLLTSQKPDKVRIDYQAQIDFNNAKFPIINEKGSTTGAQPSITIKPSARLGRVNIYLYTFDSDNQINLMPGDKDELVVNVSVAGTHLKNPIKESARIKPFPNGEPITFTYPMPIDGTQPIVTFSAMGVIGTKLVRAKEQPITLTEESVFIVVDKNGVRLISKEADLPESDPIADRLLAAGTNPVINLSESENKQPESEKPEPNGNGNGAASKKAIAGTLTAVEYGKFGPALWIEELSGSKQRVMLHDVEEADPFDDEGRKKVKVLVDETGYAESIVVEL